MSVGYCLSLLIVVVGDRIVVHSCQCTSVVDIFSVDAEKNDTVNKESGGLYIIADLCHYVSNEGTYTKMNLARDSFGRTGNHSNNR